MEPNKILSLLMIGNDGAMHGPVTHAGGRKPEKAK